MEKLKTLIEWLEQGRLLEVENVMYGISEDGYENINADLCIFRRVASAGKEKFTDTHTQT